MKFRPLIGRLMIAWLSTVVSLAVCVVSIVDSIAVTVTASAFVASRSLKSSVWADPSVMTTLGPLCFPKPCRLAVTVYVPTGTLTMR